MKICYLYNEILPKKTAHDVYIYQNCQALGALHDVTLICGSGSLSPEELHKHYLPKQANAKPNFKIKTLPILRKNNPLNLSWNWPFFFLSQLYLKQQKPDVVILSVNKQAHYHITRRLPGVRYLYEAHELAFYPAEDFLVNRQALEWEKQFMNHADQVSVTTESMKNILQAPPYNIKTPIEVIPLATFQKPLPPPAAPEKRETLKLFYVGQLYASQGVDKLFKALKLCPTVKLHVIGGSEDDIRHLTAISREEVVDKQVIFHGFCPPAQLSKKLQEADAFVAPFTGQGRMPYVAHTKLIEYLVWGRPVIVPDLPACHDHLPEQLPWVLMYEVDNIQALATQMKRLANPKFRESLYKQLLAAPRELFHEFSWKGRSEIFEGALDRLMNPPPPPEPPPEEFFDEEASEEGALAEAMTGAGPGAILGAGPGGISGIGPGGMSGFPGGIPGGSPVPNMQGMPPQGAPAPSGGPAPDLPPGLKIMGAENMSPEQLEQIKAQISKEMEANPDFLKNMAQQNNAGPPPIPGSIPGSMPINMPGNMPGGISGMGPGGISGGFPGGSPVPNMQGAPAPSGGPAPDLPPGLKIMGAENMSPEQLEQIKAQIAKEMEANPDFLKNMAQQSNAGPPPMPGSIPGGMTGNMPGQGSNASKLPTPSPVPPQDPAAPANKKPLTPREMELVRKHLKEQESKRKEEGKDKPFIPPAQNAFSQDKLPEPPPISQKELELIKQQLAKQQKPPPPPGTTPPPSDPSLN